MKIKGIIFTIFSALLFGVTPILASKTYDMGSNPETLTFYRNLLVVPILFVIMLVKKVDFKIDKKTALDIVIIGCLGRGVTTLMLYSSYDYIGVGTATTIHFLYPVFVALICFVFYKEKLDLPKIFALTIACGGVMFFLEKGHTEGVFGLAIAVASSVTYAFYMVGMDKKKLKDINPFKVSFYMAIAVATGMLFYNIPTKKIVFALPPKAFLYTFVIAICTSLLAVVFLQIGIKHLNATVASIFCLFEPIACSVAGVIFLSERITVAKIIGSALILSAVVLIMVAPKIKMKKAQPSEAAAVPDCRN